MAITIAISGKGGSGKTTLAAMIIRALIEQKQKPILAVDADPNSCLGLVTGAMPDCTIAQIREKARTKNPANSGTDRIRSFEYDIQQAITEANGFDLITMGSPEGPDCYCAANNLLRQFLDRLSTAFKFVIMDNEAGMEHLSRRTTNNVDLLCIVAEPTRIGDVTAKRIFDLAEKLPITVKQKGIIWNKTENKKSLDDIDILTAIPYDKAIENVSMQPGTVFDIPDSSPALLAVKEFVDNQIDLN